jgi:hypothetical protein
LQSILEKLIRPVYAPGGDEGVAPAPAPEVAEPVSTLTDPGLDKSWFNLTYTITQHRTDAVIARNLEDAIRVLKEDLESEGVENFVITSATPTK